MKSLLKIYLAAAFITAVSCDDDTKDPLTEPINTTVNFQYKSTIQVGGEGASEISAYDPITKNLFTVNVESQQISIYNIDNLSTPQQKTPIEIGTYGSPNSVAVSNGKLAVAVEALTKQNDGVILLFDTTDSSLIEKYTVGALPDMVTFSKDGKLIISANEGEPNSDYTIDPKGTISIIDIAKNTTTILDFAAFNADLNSLTNNGFRVFGPNASLENDVEPEYIAVSEDSKVAWVSLQENNGIAKINLVNKTIENIYPLGFKDYNITGNEIDASDKDGVKELKNWPVKSMYQPDAITSVNINGTEYIISANEGDSRDYDGFSEETRVSKITLDETAFPTSQNFQDESKLGRLKITTTLGDTDNDGDYDELYSYGARSFSIWTENVDLIYDSGNSIAVETLNATPNIFNGDDGRSDDKGAEPESVEILNIGDQRYILFVGLERNSQVLVYDITNPNAPIFLNILSHSGDQAPEGLLAIPASESPSGKDLLVVSNEDSGTVTFYENIQ
ncbi:choice-of-anchor I family protein [uncultured Lutibacter sp.]|uniref:choice-of-anchor I family protein n=1 Tax=uncultured Lutibacter sp. TaxID=437739 RepID=UPI0026332810|nr:choice-of-anchor I family protein [uncultured Lutibacter sp.]